MSERHPDHKEITIGLFGTCDNIQWRKPFMEHYDLNNVAYFNPMVDDWHPGLVELENYYLNNAEIVLFPILAASLGSGSLGEIGFSLTSVMRNISNGRQQFLISLIDDDCTDMSKTEEERKRSVKDRVLVKSKLKNSVTCPVITLVNTLDELLYMSMNLYELLANGCPAEEVGDTKIA